MRYFIGTSGFTLQNFYSPETKSAERLDAYARVFSTVEINSTFYHQPRTTTIQKWLMQVPADFVFAFKVFQGVTHRPFTLEALQKWFGPFAFLQDATVRHVMLFQYPASHKYDREQFEQLLAHLPPYFRYAFEFRHPTWFTQEVYSSIANHDATIVWSDAPLNQYGAPMWPKVYLQDAPFAYLRFHGSQKLYYSSYTDKELQAAAELVRLKGAAGKDVFAYFNNDAQAHAAENARRFLTMTGQ